MSDEKGIVKFRPGYTLFDRRTSSTTIEPEDFEVGEGLTPAMWFEEEPKPWVDWEATRRAQTARTQVRQAVLATRFKRAAELLGMLNARAEAITAETAKQAPEAGLKNPASTRFDKPHLWRGMSMPHQPDGLWMDPEAPQFKEASAFAHEIHDLLVACRKRTKD